ncbi:MAG: 50S ribosomal protein L7/L12 [Betaproteobacteria bacterium HGW-Betaproteobacteria-20]|jgi:ribosomal protein L7/L12|nr:MAG: 50S ribosomal protein L7/L12 [Betaproteobacteria bacterium HGW-Betaproteobacteria-20]
MATTENQQLPLSAIDALKQGRKIEAIKLIRQLNGLGLKEAKDLIDDYLRSHPELQSQEKIKESSLSVVIIFLVLIFTAYWFFIRR